MLLLYAYMFVHTYKSHTNKQKYIATHQTNNTKVPRVHFATRKRTYVVCSTIDVSGLHIQKLPKTCWKLETDRKGWKLESVPAILKCQRIAVFVLAKYEHSPPTSTNTSPVGDSPRSQELRHGLLVKRNCTSPSTNLTSGCFVWAVR